MFLRLQTNAWLQQRFTVGHYNHDDKASPKSNLKILFYCFFLTVRLFIFPLKTECIVDLGSRGVIIEKYS